MRTIKHGTENETWSQHCLQIKQWSTTATYCWRAKPPAVLHLCFVVAHMDRDQQVVSSLYSEEHQLSKPYHTYVFLKGCCGRAEQTIRTNTIGQLVQPPSWEGYLHHMYALCWTHPEGIWFIVHMVHEDCLHIYMGCCNKVTSVKKMKQNPKTPSSETSSQYSWETSCVACT